MATGAAEGWIRSHVRPTGPIEVVHERPLTTVLRVPVAGGAAWFKACAPILAFEPRLAAALAERWPDRLAAAIAYDEAERWLLLEDGGTPLQAIGDSLDAWLRVLPLYAELQIGETRHVEEHLAAGVPDLRPHVLPSRYEALLARDLGLEPDEVSRLRAFAPRFAELCAAVETPASVQHDDLHGANVFAAGDRIAILDWGDASIADPFASLLVTFRVLAHHHGLAADDPWLTRLRDAYLEPWGAVGVEAFERSLAVAALARVLTWLRQFDALAPADGADVAEGIARNLRRFLDEVAR